MIRHLPGFILLCCLSGAQVAPKPATQGPSPKPTAPQTGSKPTDTAAGAVDAGAAVPATAAVITVEGVCPAAPPKSTPTGQATAPQACTTTVTKAQFENLLNALNSTNQSIPPAMRRNLAQAYVELLAFSQAAEKAGIDKDSRFLEVMRLVRMRTLADLYRRDLEEKYRTPPQAEIQAYYNQNVTRYEEIKLSRIFIPAKNTAAQNKDDWEKRAAQMANDLHDRAAKGEDLDKLQKEAFTTLGLTIAPPSTVLGPRRRGMLGQSDEQELFALKTGEVSKVEQEPAGYIIYKIESRQTLPVEQVKDEISRELFRQKLDAQLKAVTGSVKSEFNDQYFGAAASPAPSSGKIEAEPPKRPVPGQSPHPNATPQPSTTGGVQPPKAPPQ